MPIAHPAAALAAVSLLIVSLAGPADAATSPRAASVVDMNAVDNYIISVYEDLLDRPPDWTGEYAWGAALRTGTPRITVANAITSSDEFRSDLITGAYAAYLGRKPDPAGSLYWLHQMGAGTTLEQLDSGFIASDEYWAAAGATRSGWVQALYADVLGRAAGDSEVAYWVGQLNAGATRTQVAMGFLMSAEYLSSIIDGYYRLLLGRGLDPTGLRTWVSAIQHGARDEQVIGGIIASEEYWSNESSRPFVGFIRLSPRQDLSAPLGSGVSYAVEAYQPSGELIGDATDAAHITVDGEPCLLGYCVPSSVGAHEVHAEYRGLNDWATLTVVPVE